MSKKKIQNTQCRRCLGELTWEEVESSICIHCGKLKKEHFGQQLYCNSNLEMDSHETFKAKLIRKLYNKDLCKKCLDKDEKKKRRIKCNQKKIGIKAIRRKKKILWKNKPEEVVVNNEPLPVLFVKRNKRNETLIKNSPKSRWKKVSSRQFSNLQKKNSIVWNPEEKTVHSI